MLASELWFVVPGDPGQNTGGYRYVRRLVAALNQVGTEARIKGLAGRFPQPDQAAEKAMDEFLASLPEGTRVVLDGLAMGAMPEVLQRHRSRLQLMALVHHPLADETGLSEAQQAWFQQAETLALAQVGRVFTTSTYTAARVEQAYAVPASRIVTAQPAVDDVFFEINRTWPDEGEARQTRLLCVGHLSARKAQCQLVEALHSLADLPWQCTLVGAQDRDPDYAGRVNTAIAEAGLAERIQLVGELDGPGIARAYGNADLFVFPSLYEGYGMVIDEALAGGLPVLSSDGGALALTARKPGACTYPAGSVSELADQLRALLTKPSVLSLLTQQAMASRHGIRRWSDTARDFLEGMECSEHDDPARFSEHWLITRERADHAARSQMLTDTLGQWLTGRHREAPVAGASASPRPLQCVDIGTGRGSNPAYLIPRLPEPQCWTLVEPDNGLLQAAMSRVKALDVTAESLCVELTANNLDEVLPTEVDLVTASALIDLVSDNWLAAFSVAIARRRSAVLVVLSYSGHFDLIPPHPSDRVVRELVNRHQHGDKGSGAALGPEATGVLERQLQAAGFHVQLANSTWHLGESGNDTALIDLLMTGWAKAAIEQDAGAANVIEQWLQDRRAQLAAQALTVTVAHLDLLALPGAQDR
ncbi:glycosyltransferase family 4 protein [Marinobacter sp. SS5-14b]|uniref:glycosyltransferase family 4 protein n=1 Tax=Marinobacter sp. SS5-14b TaxID=3050456 RepID=UPI0026DFDD78|nr:glycosyltransferase family 4 protein [Marinobacter sp. SS5-14b]